MPSAAAMASLRTVRTLASRTRSASTSRTWLTSRCTDMYADNAPAGSKIGVIVTESMYSVPSLRRFASSPSQGRPELRASHISR